MGYPVQCRYYKTCVTVFLEIFSKVYFSVTSFSIPQPNWGWTMLLKPNWKYVEYCWSITSFGFRVGLTMELGSFIWLFVYTSDFETARRDAVNKRRNIENIFRKNIPFCCFYGPEKVIEFHYRDGRS